MRGFSTTRPYTHSREIREAWIDFFEESEAQLYVTFTANRSITQTKFRTLLKGWTARIDNAALGRRWSRKSAEERTFFIGAFEKMDTYHHFHSLMRLPPNGKAVPHQLMQLHWGQLVKSGKLDVQRSRNVRAVAAYITKEYLHSSADDRILVSTEFHAK